MKTKFFIFLFFSILLIPTSVNSQTRRDVRNFTNFNRFIKRAMPAIENSQARKNTKNDIIANREKITSILEWNQNSGILYRVRAQKNTISRATIFLPTEYIGIGESPLTALVKSYSEPRASTSPSQSVTMRMDNGQSFYIWITNKRNFLNRKGVILNYGLIDQNFFKSLNLNALSAVSNLDLKNKILNNRKIAIIEGVFEKLKSEIDDEVIYNRVYNLKNQFLQQSAEIEKLELELSENLEEINNANRALKMMNTFDQIISFSNLALQVSAATNIPSSEIDKAKSASDLRAVLEESITKIDSETVLIRTNLKVQKTEVIKSKDKIKGIFDQYGTPSEISIQSLF